MPPTIPGPLKRPVYLSYPPGAYGTGEGDPNSPAYAPSKVLPATRLVNDGDLATDIEQYQRPLEQLHAGGLHAAGIAFGMQITCTKGQPNVVVLPGLALDPNGRHIFLSVDGQAEIAANADAATGTSQLAPVTGAGVTLPTAPATGPYTGECYVIVQWRETFDSATYVSSGSTVVQFLDTPWLQLVTATDYQPDQQVILGAVVLDGASKIISAGYGDVDGLQRTMVSVPAQSVQLNRAITTGAPGADTAAWGELRAREAGGIELTVPHGSDQVTVMRADGGNFTTLAVAADQANFGLLGNPGIVANGGEATMRVGAPGNYGDVLVFDGYSHLAVSLIGDTGHVIVGGDTLAGQVRMKDANAQDSMSLNGDTGSAVVQNLAAFGNGTIDPTGTINVNARFLHVHGWDLALDGRSGNNNRALVDWGNQLIVNFNGDYRNGVKVQSDLEVTGNLAIDQVLSAQGVPLMGNPARKVAWTSLLAGSVGGGVTRAYADLILPSKTQFSAICVMMIINSTSNFDYDNGISSEIWAVDGVVQPWFYENGGQWGPPGDNNNARAGVASGTGQIITFRLTSLGPDLQAQAFGIVFYE